MALLLCKILTRFISNCTVSFQLSFFYRLYMLWSLQFFFEPISRSTGPLINESLTWAHHIFVWEYSLNFLKSYIFDISDQKLSLTTRLPVYLEAFALVNDTNQKSHLTQCLSKSYPLRLFPQSPCVMTLLVSPSNWFCLLCSPCGWLISIPAVAAPVLHSTNSLASFSYHSIPLDASPINVHWLFV